MILSIAAADLEHCAKHFVQMALSNTHNSPVTQVQMGFSFYKLGHGSTRYSVTRLRAPGS